VLHDLGRRFEALEPQLFQPGTNLLKGHLFVARNGEQAQPMDLVATGDQIDLLMATAGGRGTGP
jgi:hypothetical protein